MNGQSIRRRRAACRAGARTLAIAAAAAALAATLLAGQALAVPDERVLERQGRTDRHLADAQADEEGKAGERSGDTGAQFRRRYLPPEPPVSTGPRLETDEQLGSIPEPTESTGDRDGLAVAAALAALLLAVAAAVTWRIHRRRPRPEPTT